jgi:2-methylcitrate dehydratase PrpD
VTAGLGSGWKLPGTSIKPYPSCRHTHSSVDAVLQLRRDHGLTAADVERVEIDGYHSVLDLTDNATPTHQYAAKFSVQYCAGRALMDGALLLGDFTDERIGEPALRDLMQRTDVRLDPELDARYPAEFPARVRLTLRDGRTVEQVVYSPKGDPEAPLSEAELQAKFLGLVEANHGYGASGADLLTAIIGLDGRPDVRGLLTARA